jgi:hypothetical protein
VRDDIDAINTAVGALDHGSDLTGLDDDDHSAYVLAEPSSTDNQIVRWDGTSGRAIQSSGPTISDSSALDMNGGTISNVSNVTAQAAAPYLGIDETDAGSNERLWRLTADGAVLSLQTRTDLGASGANAMQVSRSGTTVSGISFGASLDLLGNDISNVDDLNLSSASPAINFIDSSGSTNGKRWRAGTSGDDLIILMRNDADASIGDALALRRTGATLDQIDAYADVDLNSHSLVSVVNVGMTGALTGATHVEADRVTSSGAITYPAGAVENNYNIADASQLYITSDGAGSVFSGFNGGQQGRDLYITHVGGGGLTIAHLGAGSTNANRVRSSTGASFGIAVDVTRHLRYQAGSVNRWRDVT